MYCMCGAKNGFTAQPLPEGGFNYDLWVCSKCLKPTRLVFQKMTYGLAPFNAIGFLSLLAKYDGSQIFTWRLKDGSHVQTMTYKPYPRKIDMPLNGREPLLHFWTQLDELIDAIRDDSGVIDPHLEERKVQARVYADVLSHLMHPFYSDSNAVLAESMVRWEGRRDGTEHQSPGLAESVWDPASRFDGTPYSLAAETAARNGGAPGKPVPTKLDDQKANFCKTMLENGTMSVATLAGMFGVSSEVIEATVS